MPPFELASYLGLAPSEHSSGGRQRLGHISKQGNALLRGLLPAAGEAMRVQRAYWLKLSQCGMQFIQQFLSC